jgi:hypothetical protein
VAIQAHLASRVEGDALAAETLLHGGRGLEMSGAGESTATVDYTMTRQVATRGFVKRPPDGSRSPARAQVLGDVPVRADMPRWYARDDLVDSIEKVLLHRWAFDDLTSSRASDRARPPTAESTPDIGDRQLQSSFRRTTRLEIGNSDDDLYVPRLGPLRPVHEEGGGQALVDRSLPCLVDRLA